MGHRGDNLHIRFSISKSELLFQLGASINSKDLLLSWSFGNFTRDRRVVGLLR
jgi:hypothetical protein